MNYICATLSLLFLCAFTTQMALAQPTPPAKSKTGRPVKPVEVTPVKPAPSPPIKPAQTVPEDVEFPFEKALVPANPQPPKVDTLPAPKPAQPTVSPSVKSPEGSTTKTPVKTLPSNPRRVYSSYQEVDDPLFAYCGEFMGQAFVGNKTQQVGLQISVRKSGEFMATLYEGGLPGDGWNLAPAQHVNAKLVDHKLTFTFPGIVLDLTTKAATVIASSNSQKYPLKKLLRQSPTLGMTPPGDAVLLFDQGKPDKLVKPELTENGLLQEGTETTDAYADFRLHVEFSVPYLPDDDDQKRGNSGIYIQGRYEIQILDSFGEDPRFNSSGALYRQQPADLNMSLPPLSWQTYDIWFEAAKFDAEGKKTNPARVTVFLNGFPVHYHREIKTKTGAGKPEGPQPLATKFQDHSDPVRFRSIWIQPGKQPLPENKLLFGNQISKPKPTSSIPQTTSPSYSGTTDHPVYHQAEFYENQYQPAYPYAHPENYTRSEPYGSYGKLWPFSD